MTKRLVIMGAGGLGCEALAYAQDLGLQIAGFLDDDPAAPKKRNLDVPVLGNEVTWQPSDDDVVCVAIGDPTHRARLASKLEERGARFISLVHPTAYVAQSARVADGCIVAPFAFVAPHARVDRHVVLNTYASCGHDSVIGAFCTLSPYAVINGGATLQECVFMGSGAIVTPTRRIGAHSKIAAGAVVMRDVEEKSLAMGNPATARRFYR